MMRVDRSKRKFCYRSDVKHPKPTFAFFLLLFVQFVVTTSSGAETPAQARRLAVPDAFTPVVVDFLGDATAAVEGTDGRWHVVYELWLTNARPVPARIEQIEVLDHDQQERVLATFSGASLAGALHALSTRPAPDATLAPDTSKLVYVELTFDTEAEVPRAIVHRLKGSGANSPASQAPGPIDYLAAPWDLTKRKVPVLGPPLRGKGFVAANGCCSARGAHRGAILPVDGELRDAQRYAIDWMRIDEEGRIVVGDPTRAENYLVYDLPILSVADGTVVQVLDGLEDQTPGSLPDPTTITVQNVDGNHVIVDIGNGLHAFYAHMKKGSVRVKPGDGVKRGQELGRVGNTGNTSAPHLHLHLMTTPSALAGDGVPYVFGAFDYAGRMDADQWYTPETPLEATYRVKPDGRGPRTRQLPLDLSIVDFPESAP